MAKKSKKENKGEKKPSAKLTQISEKNNKTLKTVIFAGIAVIVTSIAFFLNLIFRLQYQDELNSEKSNSNLDMVNESNTAQGTLPQFFPVDFPIFENAVLKNNWTTKSSNVTGVSLVWETDQAPAKVFNFYFSELSSQGYTVEVVSQTEKVFTLSFEKGSINGFTGITMVDTKTLISVTVGIKNED